MTKKKMREYQQKHYYQRKKDSKCVDCCSPKKPVLGVKCGHCKKKSQNKSLKWYYDHAAKANKSSKEYGKTFNGQVSRLKYRFKHLGIIVTKDQLFQMSSGCCPYCGVRLHFGYEWNISIDHKQPVSRDGKNELENLHLVCKSCNMMKGNFNDDEFSRIIDFLNDNPDLWSRMKGRLKMGGFMFSRK